MTYLQRYNVLIMIRFTSALLSVRLILLCSLFLMFLSCTDEGERLNKPEDVAFDIDQNGDSDVEIRYVEESLLRTPEEMMEDRLNGTAEFDFESFDTSVRAMMSASDGEMLFEQLEDEVVSFVELQIGDTILVNTSTIDSSPLWYSNEVGGLLEIKRDQGIKKWQEWGQWPFQLGSDMPYFGIKIGFDLSSRLCWFQLDYNRINGVISLLNSNCVETDFIVVGE